MRTFVDVGNTQLYFHVIPVALIVGPILFAHCVRTKNRKVRTVHAVWLVAASLAWVIGLVAPRIYIGPSNSIVAHFVASAFTVTFLYIYFQRTYRWDATTRQKRAVTFFGFGSFFIFLNEAAEVVTYTQFNAVVNMNDVPYDIVVGYVGVSAAFIGREIVRKYRQQHVMRKIATFVTR